MLVRLTDESQKRKFDVVISDTSDPEGPAAALFEAKFYRTLHHALKAGGRIATQAESVWLDLDLIAGLVKIGHRIFENVAYATTQIPTYAGGQIGILIAKKACEGVPKQSWADFKKVCRPMPKGMQANLKYYTIRLHDACFRLPKFVHDRVAAAIEETETDEAAASAAKRQKL